MPLFTLWPSGDDRSTISLHLLGLLFLAAQLLSVGSSTMRPCSCSSRMYLSTTLGLSIADCMFLGQDQSWLLPVSQSILNPCLIPLRRYSLNCLSGYLSSSTTHFSISTSMGVTIDCWPSHFTVAVGSALLSRASSCWVY